MIQLPEKHRILVVDDEVDVHTVTRLGLRGMKYRGRSAELRFATSGEEAVEAMRKDPTTAVILLDVVMESETAGLDACKRIREEQGNYLVRILLRTGQPGVAPEKQAIDDYDIDGYLPKAELTTTRLYAAVRTAVKAFEELVELERHRELLDAVHQSVLKLHAFEPMEDTLQSVLATAWSISESPLAVLDLNTLDEHGNAREIVLHMSTDADAGRAKALSEAARTLVMAELAKDARTKPGELDDGYLVPLTLPRDLGRGWIYLDRVADDPLVRKTLTLLAAHAANALYSNVAQAMLAEREGPFYDSVSV